MLAALGIIAGVLPFAGAIVQGIESLFGHGNGSQKKQAAMTAISSIFGAYGAATGNTVVLSEAPAAEAAIANLIDAVVGVYNEIGIFTHAAPKQVKAAA